MRTPIALTVGLLMLAALPSAEAGLIADYSLDGNTIDNVTSSIAAATDVTPTSNRFGVSGSAMTFNGTSSNVSPLPVGIDSATDDFSLSLWFRTDEIVLGKFQGLASNNSAGISGVWHATARLEQDGRLLFIAGRGQTSSSELTVVSSSIVSEGVWNHAAFLYDFNAGVSTLSIYINGTLDGTASKTFSILASTPDSWALGAQNANVGLVNYFDGALDDFQIYDHVLSESEIAALASSVIPEPSTFVTMGLGLIGLAGYGWRRRRASHQTTLF